MDTNAIGQILRSYGLSETGLSAAVSMQQYTPGLPLGEACVRLGLVRPDVLEVALQRQQAVRGKSVVRILALAMETTRRLSDAAQTGSLLLAERCR